jgi:hypothetical protein
MQWRLTNCAKPLRLVVLSNRTTLPMLIEINAP